METLVIEEKANGLRTKAVVALLRDGQAVRRCEVVINQAQDAAAFVVTHAAELWPGAAAADLAWWLAVRERQYRAYYYTVLRAVDMQRAAGGTLDMALAAALAAINANDTKRAEFDQWREMAQLKAADIQTTQDKRDLLVAVLAFVNAGLIGGARL